MADEGGGSADDYTIRDDIPTVDAFLDLRASADMDFVESVVEGLVESVADNER
jgi:hypothetical protein